jgi:hypothetical protein
MSKQFVKKGIISFDWIPACAGMTEAIILSSLDSRVGGNDGRVVRPPLQRGRTSMFASELLSLACGL